MLYPTIRMSTYDAKLRSEARPNCLFTEPNTGLLQESRWNALIREVLHGMDKFAAVHGDMYIR
jgi:hypothetical protein